MPKTKGLLTLHQMEILWIRMAEIFGHKWTASYGDKPNEMWIYGLRNINKNEIKRGMSEMVNQGDSWPPSLTQFNKMCRSGAKPYKALTHLPGRKEILHQRETTKASRDAALKEIYNNIM